MRHSFPTRRSSDLGDGDGFDVWDDERTWPSSAVPTTAARYELVDAFANTSLSSSSFTLVFPFVFNSFPCVSHLFLLRRSSHFWPTRLWPMPMPCPLSLTSSPMQRPSISSPPLSSFRRHAVSKTWLLPVGPSSGPHDKRHAFVSCLVSPWSSTTWHFFLTHNRPKKKRFTTSLFLLFCDRDCCLH